MGDEDVAGAARKAVRKLKTLSKEPPPPKKKKKKPRDDHKQVGSSGDGGVKEPTAGQGDGYGFQPAVGDIGEHLRQLELSLRKPARVSTKKKDLDKTNFEVD